MKIVVLFVGLILLVSNPIQSANVNDSIYVELYNFILKAKGPEFVKDKILNPDVTIKSYLFIDNLLNSEIEDCNINLSTPFGIYMFNYIGISDDDFVLIKVNDLITIYKMNNLNGILCEIYRIRNKYPDLISNEHFLQCVKNLVDFEEYKSSIVVRIGRFDYVVKSSKDLFW